MVADAFVKIDLIEEHNQVYLKQRKKPSFPCPKLQSFQSVPRAETSDPSAAVLRTMRHCFTVLQGLSYTPELPQHSLSVGQAVLLHQGSTQTLRGRAASGSWPGPAARG